jgi:predicted negative regulator of RcsB-dependent stress response
VNTKVSLPDDPEIIVAVTFLNKYRNLIIGGVILVALLLVGKVWYNDNAVKTQKLASDKLFLIKTDFESKNYDKVIKDGLENISKYSSYSQSGEMMLLVAKTYIAMNKPDDAIAMLEKCASSFSSDDLLAYSANYMLGVISLDKAVLSNDKAVADKAVGYFEKAAKTNQEIFADQSNFNIAKALVLADKKDKAKEILKTLDKKEELSYALKEKTKKLLQTL